MHVCLELQRSQFDFSRTLKARLTEPLTDLSRGDDVLVLRVLIDSQTEDVVGVLQVETLGSCQDRKQEVIRHRHQTTTPTVEIRSRELD